MTYRKTKQKNTTKLLLVLMRVGGGEEVGVGLEVGEGYFRYLMTFSKKPCVLGEGTKDSNLESHTAIQRKE